MFYEFTHKSTIIGAIHSFSVLTVPYLSMHSVGGRVDENQLGAAAFETGGNQRAVAPGDSDAAFAAVADACAFLVAQQGRWVVPVRTVRMLRRVICCC